MTFSIYLDVCCFNRPFDDQAQERIRLETQAFFIILGNCQSEKWQLRVSEALDNELENTPEGRRKEQMRQWAALTKNKITLDEQILSLVMLVCYDSWSNMTKSLYLYNYPEVSHALLSCNPSTPGYRNR
jgi:hypothetical protein